MTMPVCLRRIKHTNKPNALELDACEPLRQTCSVSTANIIRVDDDREFLECRAARLGFFAILGATVRTNSRFAAGCVRFALTAAHLARATVGEGNKDKEEKEVKMKQHLI